MARSRRVADDDIGAQIEALRTDLAALSRAVKNRAVNEAGAARSSVTSSVDELQEQIGSLLSNITDTGSGLAADARARTTEAYEAVESTIQKNPGTAVLAALGIGFLVGALSRGQR
ncbi:hypothetical protein GCM10007276_29580 [Agaricicola taiwanensis]|uniref:DUF883 domain-containing protein n=1 Tax=Agaricicola taiwanensis TaxID=591372 RepID=A0A8J2YLE7_9RHOB|nr:DUF883 family protein [Agaricicola taiwanensis]GGE50582.1 hypothetical protein GCM10007276_29580 [Agaricicola taiwanensis]